MPPAPGGEVWLGDDAAVLRGGLLFATDVLVEGVHFDLAWSTPADAGWKALAVNCSDLAAMGGTARAAVVAVVVPAGRAGLADAVAAGLVDAAGALGCPLVGGDTTVGESLVISVAVIGDAPAGGAVLRSGARSGDSVLVSGPLGAARAALRRLRAGTAPDPDGVRRLHRPVPRLAEGAAAAGAGATAMIDLSDGLSSDVAHLARASGVGVRLFASAVPLGPGAVIDDALAGGDDYELCFTAPDPERTAATFTAAGLPAPVAIGAVTPGADLVLVHAGGAEGPLPARGYEHDVP